MRITVFLAFILATGCVTRGLMLEPPRDRTDNGFAQRGHEYLHANGLQISGNLLPQSGVVRGEADLTVFHEWPASCDTRRKAGSPPECDKTEFIRSLR
jgi:hypothetical protein